MIPHKCPVCDGWGERTDNSLGTKTICRACKGEGIVWERTVRSPSFIVPEARGIENPTAEGVGRWKNLTVGNFPMTTITTVAKTLYYPTSLVNPTSATATNANPPIFSIK